MFKKEKTLKRVGSTDTQSMYTGEVEQYQMDYIIWSMMKKFLQWLLYYIKASNGL
jgi:hypothetical protein